MKQWVSVQERLVVGRMVKNIAIDIKLVLWLKLACKLKIV